MFCLHYYILFSIIFQEKNVGSFDDFWEVFDINFYHYQPDLFICAYDDDIPIAAVMSTLKPYYDGLHLTETELFVSEDYRGQNIGKKLLEMHFELAIAKYDVSRIDAITYINNPDSPLDWYKKIGLRLANNLVILHGNLENCLKKIREEL